MSYGGEGADTAGEAAAPYPQNSRELARWRYYDSWDWYPIRAWPWKHQREAISDNAGGYRGRWSLLLFFCHNGMEPVAAAAAVSHGKSLDGDASRQLQSLSEPSEMDKQLRRFPNWDMERSMYVKWDGRQWAPYLRS